MARHPVIVAGFGFRRGASLASLRAALASAQHGHPAVTLLAAPLDKLATLIPLAAALDLPLVGITPATLSAMPTRTVAPASLLARQTGSVCEASALAAAGPDAVLLAPRHIAPDRMATCAIAKGTAA